MAELEIKFAEKIISAANIEANQQMNGSQRLEENPIHHYIPDKKLMQKGEREEVNALTFVSPLAYKLIIDLREIPVTRKAIQNLDQNLRVTKGLYMIKYVPKTDKRYKKGRPWVIGQDLMKMGIYVGGPTHWNYLCDRIPELNWIRRNSGMCDELFDTAARYPGMSFWFCVDWPRYESMLWDKIKAETGAGPECGSVQRKELNPLGAYKCSAAEYRKHYKDKTATLRTLADVLHEVQDAEMQPAVQEEMIKETGESDVTRKQYIKGMGGVNQPKDPITGQFIKKEK